MRHLASVIRRPRINGLRLLVLCMGTAAPLSAQVLRGIVTEKGSDRPVAGVVLSVLDELGKVAAVALSDEDGAFVVRAPGAGRFSLDAKRIGVRQTRLAPFTLAVGETRRQDVAVEPVPVKLASVNVTRRSSCERPADNERTAAIWEDARAALTAAVITRENVSAADSVIRFTRKLDVTSWRVLFEERRKTPASMDRPFRSLAAEDLSHAGYVRVNDDGSTDYFAPDAEVLLSDPFLADHCFHLERGVGAHETHVGLAFEPVPTRTTADVRGVLWLDLKTAELRSIDFTYTWLPHGERPVDFGGTVAFFRTLAGRWIVRSWRIRTPEFGYERWIERANGERVPLPSSRTPRVVRILEEGGAVPIGALLTETGIVRGTAMIDSAAKRPLAGATVALAGNSASAVTDEDGAFALQWVPPGSYTVVLRHPALDSLGLEHLATTVDVGTGTTAVLRLQFPSHGELSLRLCAGKVKLDQEAIIRFVVVDDSTGVPMRDVPVLVSRRKATPPTDLTADSVRIVYEGMLDAQGAFLACGIPAEEIVRIEGRGRSTTPWSSQVRSAAGAIGWHLVRVPAGVGR